MHKLANLSKAQSSPSCKNIDYYQMLSYLTTSPQPQQNGLKPWLYQTCNEMGFYQTCHLNSTCPYGRGYHTLDLDLELCRSVFHIHPRRVARNVRNTLDYYGGWDVKADRILSVNGDIDPWSALSLNAKKDRKDGDYDPVATPTFWSRGASHHFWTHVVKESDGIDLMETREIVFGWVIDLIDADYESFF